MANRREPGTRRIGTLLDFNPDTPEVPATLTLSADDLYVTVQWQKDDSPSAFIATARRGARRPTANVLLDLDCSECPQTRKGRF